MHLEIISTPSHSSAKLNAPSCTTTELPPTNNNYYWSMFNVRTNPDHKSYIVSHNTRTTISGRWPSSDSGRHRLILDVLLEISPKVRPMKTPTITYGHITPSLVSSFSTNRRWNDAPPVNHKFWICIRFSTTIQHYMTKPCHDPPDRKENYQLNFNRPDNKCPLQSSLTTYT